MTVPPPLFAVPPLEFLRTPQDFARLSYLQRAALVQHHGSDAVSAAEKKASFSHVNTPADARKLPASQLLEMRSADPQRFQTLAAGRSMDAAITTREDLRALSATELVAFRKANPEKFEQIVNR